MEAFRYTPNTSRHHKKPETAALPMRQRQRVSFL